MITFDNKHRIWKLDTPHTSYLIGLADDTYLTHVYYGKKLQDTDLNYLLRTDEGPLTPKVNPAEKTGFMDRCPMEYPGYGTGDFRESCVDIKTADGQNGTELHYESYEIYKGKKSLQGLPASFGTEQDCDTLEITLKDEVTGLQVILSYTAFNDVDIITRNARAENTSKNTMYLERLLSACIDMDDEDYQMLAMHGAWAREHEIDLQPVGYHGIVNESRKGESGHESQPFVGILSKNCDETVGEVYGIHLVYSGSFFSKVQKNNFNSLRAVIGIHPEEFEWKLNPGESFQAPEAVLVYSDAGLGQMSRTLHDFYRGHLIRSKYQYAKRPVLINNWEATYFDFDDEKLLSIARQAKQCGIDMLVCDDGWFGDHRDAADSCLGDWVCNNRKIKCGLHDFAKQINDIGLKFGLWFEPEMVSPDSDLYRTHPDWALHLKNRQPALCRGQLVLDFSNPAVVNYIYDSIAAILHSANIAYMKWDMNRPLCDCGSDYLPQDQQGEIYHRHVLGVYEIQERILKEFPDLLLENCSSGGARFDPGMLYYSPQIWCSDDMDPIERLGIEEGTELLYPLSTMGAHVCKNKNDISGRDVSFETRAKMAMTGTFGYELDITKLEEEDRKQIPGQIEQFRSVQALIQKGDYYRIASYRINHSYDCIEVVDKAKRNAVVFCVQVLAQPNGISRRIKLQGLNPEFVYTAQGKQYRGDTLMNAGILIPWKKQDFVCDLVEIKAA
ncbi:MAG: alpha-galactosidase [Solobacterium sp.]|jgi:alpha-galactosidase|nr:alpha-galactosidase [Solobacterium sp.]MCH4265157.1 alpha-galactosidase [Solobacterium sp.]